LKVLTVIRRDAGSLASGRLSQLLALGSFQAAPDLGAADDLPQRRRHFFRSHQVRPLPRFWTGDIILTFPTV
jgi:hypothetical protein